MRLPIEDCGLCGLTNYEKSLPVIRTNNKTIFVLPVPFEHSHLNIISEYGDIIFETFCMNGYHEVCSVYFNMILQSHKYKNIVASIHYLQKVFLGRRFEEYSVENIYGMKIIPVTNNYLDRRVKEEIK